MTVMEAWRIQIHTTKPMGFCTNILLLIIVAASITMRLLSVLRGVTLELQSHYIDILKSHELVSDFHLEIHLLKLNCEEHR